LKKVKMCIEINYFYPHCGCIARIGHYTCYQARNIATTGFSLCCERYKKTEQEMKTGPLACPEHLKLLEERGKRKHIEPRTSEETDGEGERLIMGDGGDGLMMSGAVDGPREENGKGEGHGEGSRNLGDGEVDLNVEHGARKIGLAV
jgi:hypothetical protein